MMYYGIGPLAQKWVNKRKLARRIIEELTDLVNTLTEEELKQLEEILKQVYTKGERKLDE